MNLTPLLPLIEKYAPKLAVAGVQAIVKLFRPKPPKAEPSQPLPYTAVSDIDRQIDSATLNFRLRETVKLHRDALPPSRPPEPAAMPAIPKASKPGVRVPRPARPRLRLGSPPR